MTDPSVLSIAIVPWLAVYIWSAASLHAVFRKAGEEGWKAWVPFLNIATLLQLGGFSGWFVLLGLVPIANVAVFVMLIISYHRINLAFGYGAGMTVLAALILPVWSSILGWGSARWVGAPEPLVPGPMRRGDVAPSPVTPASGARPVEGRISPPPAMAATRNTLAPAPVVPPLPPRPPLPSAAASPPGAAADPVVPVWAPHAGSDAAPRRSTAVSADELPSPTATVAQPPAFVPSPAPSVLPTVSPTPAPPVTESDGDDAPLDWWALPPVAAADDEPPAPRRSNAMGLDAIDEDTRDVADLGRDADGVASVGAWAAPEITPPPTGGPLRSRRVAPAPEDFADEPFDTSFEVSAVAGAPTLGAPVSALSSVSAVQTGAALPDDVYRDEDALDEDAFDETVVAVRRRAVWHLRPPLGAPIAVTSDVLILGRRPASDPDFPDAQLVPISDETRTMSKTHARLELRDQEWVIVDLDSTNGVMLLGENGDEQEAVPGTPFPVHTRFLLGDAELHLIRDPGAN